MELRSSSHKLLRHLERVALLAFREPQGSLGILYSKTSKLELQVRALHPIHIPFISNSYPNHIRFISNSHPSHIQFISYLQYTQFIFHIQFKSLFFSNSSPVHVQVISHSYLLGDGAVQTPEEHCPHLGMYCQADTKGSIHTSWHNLLLSQRWHQWLNQCNRPRIAKSPEGPTCTSQVGTYWHQLAHEYP